MTKWESKKRVLTSTRAYVESYINQRIRRQWNLNPVHPPNKQKIIISPYVPKSKITGSRIVLGYYNPNPNQNSNSNPIPNKKNPTHTNNNTKRTNTRHRTRIHSEHNQPIDHRVWPLVSRPRAVEEEDERCGDRDVCDCWERVRGFGEPVDGWDEEPGAEVYAVWVLSGGGGGRERRGWLLDFFWCLCLVSQLVESKSRN